MANYPKKMIDPTEAALSAIQEALNIRDDEEQPPRAADEQGRFLRQPCRAPPAPGAAPPAFDRAYDSDDIGTRSLDTPDHARRQ